jgi:ABC-type sugar transport system permease subunit
MKTAFSSSRFKTVAAWLFLSPAILLLGVFVLWPMAYLLYLSITLGLVYLQIWAWDPEGESWDDQHWV